MPHGTAWTLETAQHLFSAAAFMLLQIVAPTLFQIQKDGWLKIAKKLIVIMLSTH